MSFQTPLNAIPSVISLILKFQAPLTTLVEYKKRVCVFFFCGYSKT